MNETVRKSRLTASLTKALNLDTLTKSNEYVNHLLPYLKELARVPYMDPSKFKTKEEYEFALDKANIRAGVYSELISFLNQQEAMMNKIRTELEKPPVSYAI